MTGPAVPPGGEELRETIVAVTHAHHKLYDRDECSCGASTRQGDVDVFHEHRADAVLALPAVRDALVGDNVYVPPKQPTWKQCRQCARDRQRRPKDAAS